MTTIEHFPRRDMDMSSRQRANNKQMNSLAIERVLKDSTARPWSASASYTGESIFLGNDGQNAGFIGGYADHPHNQANAELIVRAVNAFEPMRAEIERLLAREMWLKSSLVSLLAFCESATPPLYSRLAEVCRRALDGPADNQQKQGDKP